MEKVPIEVFISQQLKTDRYRSIISHLGVDSMTVQLALISYLKDQGVFFVSESLANELSGRVARDLESNPEFAKSISSRGRISKIR